MRWYLDRKTHVRNPAAIIDIAAKRLPAEVPSPCAKYCTATTLKKHTGGTSISE
jgi:hypothetical protein